MAVGDRERWNEKWSSRGVGTGHGSDLVDLLDPWLPAAGSLLDIAGGGSADSLAFARRGLDVTVCDVSDVGLAHAREQAAAEDLDISAIEADLESDPPPAGPWDVITVANYLQRDLFAPLIGELAPDGLLAVVIATTTNLERHERPGAAFLLDPGELPALVPDTKILHHSEAWRPNGRHESHLVVRRR